MKSFMSCYQEIRFTRRRSPTVSDHQIKNSAPLFIFSEEVQDETDELYGNNTFFCLDDNDTDSFSSPSINFHRRTPTAPNLIHLTTNEKSTILKRPIQPIFENNDNISLFPESFQPTPKPEDFCVSPCEASEEFSSLVNDKNITFSPRELGFIPRRFWPNERILLRDLVTDYFRADPSPNSRFSHKLYNALQIVKKDPFYFLLFGVEWMNETVLKVNGPLFSCVLGLQNYKYNLFSQNGQMSIHGFIELNEKDALAYCNAETLQDIDFNDFRLFLHKDGIFNANSNENDILSCRWARAKRG
ncbi:hypothetical protein TVAG_437240 [Trichomonas vaginalis G3]|uniref:Initiator binding domain-containing protein n=1 Tax=Trichomonas vaginalis (strain ATCC PRA-98 / G3) TaxID=412133 RepID=A2DFH0_TRIV3|nr:transcription-initiator DNA-binding domain ibd family [Trichomonas vaginalis G3]EAY20898.1 hypothetical protein TVAG_437240 [Trichomonas vaginalis G3]KAI5521491.1 transcription-initiator DNA-binding domain ibd family [Trichomonas vaginalis G3]|eukprot:XP_001581884.1 hypothetical protein [Trichomonas vaginalis G3]